MAIVKHLKTINGPVSVVSHCIYEETCILLALAFHAELNGLCPNSVHCSIQNDFIIKHVYAVGMHKRLMYCLSC